MGRGNTSERRPQGAEQRGLWRLMLKLPALRGRLQLLAAKTEALDSLCEAYEDASTMLEKLRNAPGEPDLPMIREYESLCSDIEADVIQYCLEHHSGVPE